MCDSTPVQTSALRGADGSLGFGRRSPWTAMSMRDRPAGCASCASRLCGALCGSGRPPRGGRRRSFVGGNRAMLAVPRIGAAPAPACAGDDGPPRGSVRPTGHSPPHGDIRRQRERPTDTRRHTATSMLMIFAAAAAGRAARFSYGVLAKHGAEKSAERGRVYLYGANSSRARARGRGAGGAS